MNDYACIKYSSTSLVRVSVELGFDSQNISSQKPRTQEELLYC